MAPPASTESSIPTGVVDKKQAQVIANQYELASRKARTLKQIMRVIGDMSKLVGGTDKLSAVTVRHHVSQWLALKEHETAMSSQAFYRSSAGMFLAYLGARAEVGLFEITKADLVGYRDTLAKSVSVVTAAHHMSVVRSIFKSACADGLLADDPSEFIKPLKKEQKAGKRSFTLPELQTLLSVADDEWRSMILFGLYTGQRLSDIAKLSWNNIDLAKEQITLTTAKTGRVMMIPLAEALCRHVDSLPASDIPGALVHPRSAGRQQSTLSADFGRLLASAGLRTGGKTEAKAEGSHRRIQSELSFHSLRHTAVSLLHEAGLPQATILEFIGHSSMAMNSKYTHTGIEQLRKAANALPPL